MSAAEEELAELLGSEEAVPPSLVWAREQANIARALWNVPPMPEQERLKIIADFLRSGKADQTMLDTIADIFDPAIDNGDQKLVFARRRARNPKAATGNMAGSRGS